MGLQLERKVGLKFYNYQDQNMGKNSRGNYLKWVGYKVESCLYNGMMELVYIS